MVQPLEVACPWEGDVMGDHRQDSHTSLVVPKDLEGGSGGQLAGEVTLTVLGELGLTEKGVQNYLAKVWARVD